jgi:hypothetical protein
VILELYTLGLNVLFHYAAAAAATPPYSFFQPKAAIKPRRETEVTAAMTGVELTGFLSTTTDEGPRVFGVSCGMLVGSSEFVRNCDGIALGISDFVGVCRRITLGTSEEVESGSGAILGTVTIVDGPGIEEFGDFEGLTRLPRIDGAVVGKAVALLNPDSL